MFLLTAGVPNMFWGRKKRENEKKGKGKKKKKRRNLKYLPFTRDDLAQYLRGLGALLS